MTEEKRRRARWVLPVLLLAGAGVLVARRSRRRPADEWRPPVVTPATPTRPAAPVSTTATVPPAAPDPGTADPAAVDPAPVDPAAEEAPPFGPGSARPRPDGSAPGPEFTIKGNAQSRLFHPPTSPYYGRTRAEVWFRTAEDAEAAGFRAYRSRARS